LYFSQWYGLWVPKGTPKGIILTLNNTTRAALADPPVRQKLAD
jgi:tripartite-type tricarboxylate transporter receptor subunit TctC